MNDSQSLQIIPEQVAKYGLEAALMLAVVNEIVGGARAEVRIDQQRLYSRAYFFSQAKQSALLQQLINANLLQLEPMTDGLVALQLSIDQTNQINAASSPVAIVAPSVANPVPAAKPQRQEQAPTLGGSTGWKGAAYDDELSRLFEAREAVHRQQGTIDINWQPSDAILQLLNQQHQISVDFAHKQKDEFIVYHLDKGRRETPSGWDQKFLKWVKKEQVYQQTAHAKAQKQTQQQSKTKYEEARFAAQERRQKVTRAVLDIGNTDW
jgi:hypothetical protein